MTSAGMVRIVHQTGPRRAPPPKVVVRRPMALPVAVPVDPLDTSASPDFKALYRSMHKKHFQVLERCKSLYNENKYLKKKLMEQNDFNKSSTAANARQKLSEALKLMKVGDRFDCKRNINSDSPTLFFFVQSLRGKVCSGWEYGSTITSLALALSELSEATDDDDDDGEDCEDNKSSSSAAAADVGLGKISISAYKAPEHASPGYVRALLARMDQVNLSKLVIKFCV